MSSSSWIGANGFLTPRNLWNLSVQTAYIGIMATGMVFVIVTRNIDLSVGSVLAMCSAGPIVSVLAAGLWIDRRNRAAHRPPRSTGCAVAMFGQRFQRMARG